MLPRVSAVFAFSVVLAACSLFEPKFDKPTLTVVGLTMLHGDLLQQTFKVTFNVENPNDRALPIEGITADLKVGGEEFATGAAKEPFTVPARGNLNFDMTITAEMALGLIKLTKQLSSHADSLEYELSGVVHVKSHFLRSVPFHQVGTFSLRGVPN